MEVYSVRKHYLKIAAGAAAVALMSAPASATTLESLSFEDMAQTADACVIATAVSSSVERRNGQIFTVTTFEVDETAFGDAPSSLSIAMPGGRMDSGSAKMMAVDSGAIRFSPNSKQMMFLENVNGAYSISGFTQGAYSVNGDQVLLPRTLGGATSRQNALQRAIDARNADGENAVASDQ